MEVKSTKTRVIVIGAGIGGIATAVRLARNGCQVTAVEKCEKPGGRCGQMTVMGHRFDTGATLFLMPELYAETYAAIGERMEDLLDLRRIDPTHHLSFQDDSQFQQSVTRHELTAYSAWLATAVMEVLGLVITLRHITSRTQRVFPRTSPQVAMGSDGTISSFVLSRPGLRRGDCTRINNPPVPQEQRDKIKIGHLNFNQNRVSLEARTPS